MRDSAPVLRGLKPRNAFAFASLPASVRDSAPVLRGLKPHRSNLRVSGESDRARLRPGAEGIETRNQLCPQMRFSVRDSAPVLRGLKLSGWRATARNFGVRDSAPGAEGIETQGEPLVAPPLTVLCATPPRC